MRLDSLAYAILLSLISFGFMLSCLKDEKCGVFTRESRWFAETVQIEQDKYVVIHNKLQHTDDFIFCIAHFVFCFMHDNIS
jgi:hypothetical protein